MEKNSQLLKQILIEAVLEYEKESNELNRNDMAKIARTSPSTFSRIMNTNMEDKCPVYHETVLVLTAIGKRNKMIRYAEEGEGVLADDFRAILPIFLKTDHKIDLEKVRTEKEIVMSEEDHGKILNNIEKMLTGLIGSKKEIGLKIVLVGLFMATFLFHLHITRVNGNEIKSDLSQVLQKCIKQ